MLMSNFKHPSLMFKHFVLILVNIISISEKNKKHKTLNIESELKF